MYSCILMDPPWQERGGGKIKRGADRHYPLVKTKAMPLLIAGSGVFDPAPDCHLWMWATNNFLPDALWLMDALGFRYLTNAVWCKDRMGLGQYLRGQHELLLLGVQGSGPAVRTAARNLPSVIRAPRGKHSAKPEEAYQLIEARTFGPRLEMFSRTARQGWTCWGNEVDVGAAGVAQPGRKRAEAEEGGVGRIECSPSEEGISTHTTLLQQYEWGGRRDYSNDFD